MKGTVQERFDAKVRVDALTQCWEWVGYTDKKGYGQLQVSGKPVRAHRLSYSLHTGTIPQGDCVCHSCDNPSCVNPGHLFLGSQEDNILDMRDKRRHRHVLTATQRLEIRELYFSNNFTQQQLGTMFGVHQTSIGKVIRDKNPLPS